MARAAFLYDPTYGMINLAGFVANLGNAVLKSAIGRTTTPARLLPTRISTASPGPLVLLTPIGGELPEPSSLALSAFGFVGLAAWSLRKAKRVVVRVAVLVCARAAIWHHGTYRGFHAKKCPKAHALTEMVEMNSPGRCSSAANRIKSPSIADGRPLERNKKRMCRPNWVMVCRQFTFAAVLALLPSSSLAIQINILHVFSVPGEHGVAGLTLVGSTLVGATSANYSDSSPPPFGRAFSLDLDGSNYQTLHSFSGPEGANPVAAFTLVGSTIYGTTSGPRAGNPPVDNNGTVFSMNPDGTNYQVIHTFSGIAPNIGSSMGSLVAIGSTLYGTESGGSTTGAIFSINEDGSNFQTLYQFTGGPNGDNIMAGLTPVGQVLYGTATNGGSGNDGVLFSINQDGSNFQILHTFLGTRRAGPTSMRPSRGCPNASRIIAFRHNAQWWYGQRGDSFFHQSEWHEFSNTTFFYRS